MTAGGQKEGGFRGAGPLSAAADKKLPPSA